VTKNNQVINAEDDKDGKGDEGKLNREMLFPIDLSQVPDIFIDIYDKKDTRVAYLRLKAADCLASKPKPNWYRLRSTTNDTGSKNIGMLMCSV